MAPLLEIMTCYCFKILQAEPNPDTKNGEDIAKWKFKWVVAEVLFSIADKLLTLIEFGLLFTMWVVLLVLRTTYLEVLRD